MRLSKKNYYELYFEENIYNSKETWRSINDIISRKAKSGKKPIHRFLQLLDISWLLVSLFRRQIMILVPF